MIAAPVGNAEHPGRRGEPRGRVSLSLALCAGFSFLVFVVIDRDAPVLFVSISWVIPSYGMRMPTRHLGSGTEVSSHRTNRDKAVP